MKNKINISRRSLLLGGLAVGAAGAIGLKPSDSGAPHNDYFEKLSDTLHKEKISKPTMVVDYDRMLENISILKSHIKDRFDYRIVAKSLPSIPMLKLVMEKSGSHRLMVFHQPFLTQVARELPDADVLMGKPMPVVAAEKFYKSFDKTTGFDAEHQLQWLIDSPKRLRQYLAMAESLATKVQVNIEIDIGLHRGGVSNDDDFLEMLHLIHESENLTLSGLMGYEPHIGKVPASIESTRGAAMHLYQHYVDLIELTLNIDAKKLCLNSGGSPTYQHYDEGSYPHNELSAGTCLVKPAGFDTDSLADHIPASYIATPVLKVLDETEIPGVAWLGDVMSAWDPNRQQAFFTYGGYWKATPVSPKGVSLNPVFGRSTNQEMYNGSSAVNLQQDDWIFMRPNQSEAVFLQFGDIAVYRDGKIVDHWPILSENA